MHTVFVEVAISIYIVEGEDDGGVALAHSSLQLRESGGMPSR